VLERAIFAGEFYVRIEQVGSGNRL